MSLHVKYSELPAGTVVEIACDKEYGERYERMKSVWISLERDRASISVEDMDLRTDVAVRSVPYEVTLKLAEWLDNVYTKRGSFEPLVIEASAETKKTKHDAHISAYPTKKD